MSSSTLSPLPEPPPKPVRKRLFKGFGITILLIPILLVVWFAVLANWPDSAEFDDAALIPVWASALRENPLARFQVWLEENVDPNEKDPRLRLPRKSSAWDPDEAKRFLEDHWEPIERFHALAAASNEPWQWREWDSIAHLDHQMPNLNSLIDVGKAVQIQVFLALEKTDIETAVGATESLLLTGAGIKEAHGSMIHHATGSALVRTGIQSAEEIAKTLGKSLSPHHFQLLADTVAEIDARSPDPGFALQAEYLVFKQAINNLLAGNIPKGHNDFQTRFLVAATPFLQRNDSLRLQFELIKPVFDSLSRKDEWSEVENALERQREVVIELESNRVRLFLSPNAIGKILVPLAAPAYRVFIERHFEDQALTRTTQILLAIARYEQSTGSPPEKLEDLVPSFLPAIPVDPFTGASMRWNPATGIIYSAGPDQVDDGGRIDEKSPQEPRDLGVKYIES